jgi:hypothetical protein
VDGRGNIFVLDFFLCVVLSVAAGVQLRVIGGCKLTYQGFCLVFLVLISFPPRARTGVEKQSVKFLFRKGW